MSKWTELGTHVRGAVRNGCSEVEIREALLQARYVAFVCSLDSHVVRTGGEGMRWGRTRRSRRRICTEEKGLIMSVNSAYCGLPSGMEAFRVADRVLNEMQEKGELVRG